MSIPKCPCKECISFAICITQTIVDCREFMSYTNKMADEHNARWEEINEVFPNAIMVYYMDSPHFYHKIGGKPRP